MSECTCGQVLVLPSQGLVHPVADDNFVVLFTKLCYAFEEKLFFSATLMSWEKSHSNLSKNEPENIP